MLKGKWALVTGATAGLGLAVADSLAGAGASIVLHDLIEPTQTRDRLRTQFDVDVLSVAADLSQRASIEAMMTGLLGRIDAVDILVNNAVVRHFSPVEHFRPERWDEALAVNLSAPFHLIRLALPAMKQRQWGRIINMASIYSTRAVADRVDYVTTKTAILGLTRAVAIETTRDGITCNALCPGTLPTPAIQARIEAVAARENRTLDEAAQVVLATSCSMIEAIKALRSARPSLGLAEAKPLVDRHMSPEAQRAANELWDSIEAFAAQLPDGAVRSPRRTKPDGIGEDRGIAERVGVGLGVGGLLGGAAGVYPDPEERGGRPPRTTSIFGWLRRR